MAIRGSKVKILDYEVSVLTEEGEGSGKLQLFVQWVDKPQTRDALDQLRLAQAEVIERVGIAVMRRGVHEKIEISQACLFVTPLPVGGMGMDDFENLIKEALQIK